VLTASAVWRLPFSTRLGDEDMVVAVVVAVGGRSSDNLDTAAPEVDGSLPVSSSRCILDLRSSSSSHTVEGAVFDKVDSVPSAPFPVSMFEGT
jgi:hypothetical protein